MRYADIAAVAVAFASVFVSFRNGGGAALRPAWAYALEGRLDTTDLHLEVLPPAPIVTDIDGDGNTEIIVATLDGRVVTMDPSANKLDAPLPGDIWRAPLVRRSVSLRSHTGLAAGRRPVALQVGAVRDGPGSSGMRRQIIVVVTEDWTVMAFSHELKLLWEHSIGRTGMHGTAVAHAVGAHMREVVVGITSHPIYVGDQGAVRASSRIASTPVPLAICLFRHLRTCLSVPVSVS